jgi:carbonic anhydrase/acetyltransferase-like protein (isoleucine patch superfamily)
MTKFDFNDGNGLVPAHKHSNGGGWVADTAKVDDTAYVGPDAMVYGNAWVYGYAKVFGYAKVCDNAEVAGDAKVYGDARVTGNAEVYGNAKVYGNALVSGYAHVCGSDKVHGALDDSPDTQQQTSEKSKSDKSYYYKLEYTYINSDTGTWSKEETKTHYCANMETALKIMDKAFSNYCPNITVSRFELEEEEVEDA